MFMTFYNVDMEKAKNINDLLEEYERMEAIIDLFFKKDVENKELEELRRWLTVSINYFRRFQKVLSTLKIKDEKINIKEAEEKEFLIEKLYLLLIENGKIRSNQKIKSINDVEIDKAVIGEPIFALITKVRRKEKWLEPGDFWWEFFEHVWLHMIPLRRGIMWCYAKVIR